ncbi:hypothetical protein [Embleya sp. NPDC059237]|uniref:hypothetical protein n=1 Tax=unclassified Embleya TaxID=2699296 RepID=UPI0036AA29E5
MEDMRCTYCGHVGPEPGFIEDSGPHATGFARWISGFVERGAFGGAKRIGKVRWQIDAFRCPNCGHLDLFAIRHA